MAGSVVYIYDANPLDLREREVQLRQQLAAADVSERWEIRSANSRNQLLVSLAADHAEAPRVESTCLIDLRAETGDLDQGGFRICETIVRELRLNAITRPVIWTDTHTAANFQRAQQVGAVAVVDDEWVDRGKDGPLAQVLDWALTQPASPSTAVGSEPRVFPDSAASLEDERSRRREAFERWFGFPPMDLHFALLWGIADAVELSFLKDYVAHKGLARSERSAKRELEKLEAAMRDEVREMERPGPARAELARRFLAEVVPSQPNPLEELSWPRLTHVREVLHEREDLVRWAYLPPGGRRLLDRFFNCLSDRQGGVKGREASINSACEELAHGSPETVDQLRRYVRFIAQAIDDSWADWRKNGEPTPIRAYSDLG